MIWTKKIESLEKQLAFVLTAFNVDSVDKAQASLEALLQEKEQFTAATEQLTAEKAKVTALEGEKTKLETDLRAKTEEHATVQKELTQLQEQTENKIRQAVIDRCAAAGLPAPVAVDPKAGDPGAKDPHSPTGKDTGKKGLAKATELLAAKMAKGS